MIRSMLALVLVACLIASCSAYSCPTYAKNTKEVEKEKSEMPNEQRI